MAQTMKVIHVELKIANDFVARLHRHHTAVIGHRYSIGCEHQGNLVGVAIVGRPVARHSDNGQTVEVLRLCTDGTPNACSFLYGAAARAAKALGYKRIQTYILASENGTSLIASGWQHETNTAGGKWVHTHGKRTNKHPLEPKQRWAKQL